jgi:xylulokinase
MSLVLGIDTSTTATKALLVERTGRVAAVGVEEYPYLTPRPLWSEQDPQLWWDATCVAVRKALAAAEVPGSAVEAVGLTGQMHGLVLLDDQDRVLRPAILWNDQRTGAECEEMRATVGKDHLVATTGNDALPGFTAPKLLWVRNHEPDLFRRAARLLLPKDYVRLRLTGVPATDCADGSGTILFDLAARTWSPEITARLGIDPDLLPPTFEGTEITGAVTSQGAAATGLRAGIPVVGGGGDQAAGAVGTGAVDEGVATLSLGTSGVVFVPTAGPSIEAEGRLHAFCHAVPGRWHLMGVMLSAAGSLRWFRDTLAPGEPFEALVAESGSVPAGAEGLLFLPYLTGERTPHPDPLARGAFVGLTVRHTRAHLLRAVLEGVAFGLADSLDLIRATGVPAPGQLRVSGGGTRSPLWRQIVADVLDVELATVTSAEGAAYGAALLAAVGAGWWDTAAEACAATIGVTGTTEPGPERDVYPPLHDRYRELYPALRPTFHA